MIIKNKTQDTILALDAKYARSLTDQLCGLLLKSNQKPLIFRTRFGIHTFGLKKTIEVIVLDKQFIIKKIARVKPNALFFWNPSYPYIIELPNSKSIQSKAIIGDELAFVTNI